MLLTITLEAKQGETTLYLVEVKQAGVFAVSGASAEDLKRLIGSFCPSVLFPYAREAVSDLIIKGGFPNFLLPLVNFDALFAQAASAPRSSSRSWSTEDGAWRGPRAEPVAVDRRRILGNGARDPAGARADMRRDPVGPRSARSSRPCARERRNARYLPEAPFPDALHVKPICATARSRARATC